jgi:NAD(P)-dependent dehydrogenase (short-subunit alcohol dehydrogenase family)
LTRHVPRTRFSSSAQPPDFGGRYEGVVAVVTGASSGLGAQLSVDLARAGATVQGLARTTERLDKLATDLRTFTPGSGTITCDVADTAALRQALSAVTASHGPVELLVNNAAQDPGVRLADITEEDFRHTFDVNFFAPVAATLAVLPAMLERGSGIVVNVSSDGGRLPSPGPGAYSSSKAALSAFTESTSFRLGAKGVHVHVVYPAFMATELGPGSVGARPAQTPAPDHPQRRGRVAQDFGPGGRAGAGNQRVRPDRRRHGLPFSAAPPLPPSASTLVGGGPAPAGRA